MSQGTTALSAMVGRSDSVLKINKTTVSFQGVVQAKNNKYWQRSLSVALLIYPGLM